MEQQLKILIQKQEVLEKSKETLKEKKQLFEMANAGLIEEIRILEDSYNETKNEVKIEAIDEFKSNGIKKLLGGIGIRVLKKLFYDEEIAIGWAKENMPVAIVESIDRKQFETFAKSKDLEFVKKEETISVTFPKEIKL